MSIAIRASAEGYASAQKLGMQLHHDLGDLGRKKEKHGSCNNVSYPAGHGIKQSFKVQVNFEHCLMPEDPRVFGLSHGLGLRASMALSLCIDSLCGP